MLASVGLLATRTGRRWGCKRKRLFPCPGTDRGNQRATSPFQTFNTFPLPRKTQKALKSQPRTGHTREPDPTHNELKHTTTRKTATHERTL